MLMKYSLSDKSLQSKKKKLALTSVLLCQPRNIVGQPEKAFLRRPIKVLHFFTPARIQKCLI